jgi:RecA/RadA recombinase
MAAKKKQTKENKKEVLTPAQQFDNFLDTTDDHFNHAEQVNYVVSSGSLKLDIEMGGGLRPGVVRFCGTTEGGKTSAALSFGKNFLDTVDNSFLIYIKAEGRFSSDILKRSGLDDPKYKETFRVYRNNVYESVIELLEDHINNNPLNTRYMFIIDSMDALNLRDDLKKDITGENSPKVAGSAGLSSLFLKRMTLALCELGHLCVMISQKRAHMSVSSKFSGDRDERFVPSSGGFALLHYSDWILEFQERTRGDTIFINETLKGAEKYNPDNIIGHNCAVEFSKTPNEKKFVKVKYPIKHGRTGGKSIWREKEVLDFLEAWKYIKVSGSWISFDEALVAELKSKGIEVIEKIQGKNNLSNYLEENPKICDFFFNEFLKALKRDV